MAAPPYTGGGFSVPPSSPPPDQTGPQDVELTMVNQNFVSPGGGSGAPPPNYSGSPITFQPTSAPPFPKDCPQGLEYLTSLEQLFVKQKVEVFETVTGVLGLGFETNNKYSIRNSLGQQFLKAEEDTGCCVRFCCGPYRPFEMKIFDATTSA